MFRRSATLPPAAGDVARAAERIEAAAAARRGDWEAALGAAPAWLTRARMGRSRFPDFYHRAARDRTADACAEAERRARLPPDGLAEGS
jgi:hypothetical protein